MQVDSEIQRQQLLACIRDTHITGTFQQVAEAVPVIHALMNAVATAEVVIPSEVPDGKSE